MAAPTPTPAAVADLGVRYGDRAVLDAVSLALTPGSVLGLIGRNGAGKSTLIRCLLGLQQPAQGGARLFGEPALALSDAAKARIGYVPQQPDTLPWLTAAQMLEFVGRFYPRWDADLAAELQRRWQVPSGQLLGKLSPGERQKLALIRALAPQPELLVLDEPAAALDPVARRELLREIASRAGERGTTVLFSTHILSDLERVASHVAFLDGGRLLLTGELDEVKERHARLWLPASLSEQAGTALPGELRRRRAGDGSLQLLLALPDGRPPALAQAPGARLDPLGLEDLFLEVVG